jgi:hypothetical protein
MSGELQLSIADRAWLAEMDRAMLPADMVAAKQYQAAVESRDAAVRRIHLMRGNRRRMWTRYKRMRQRLFLTEWAAVAVVGLVVLWRWQ